MVRRTFAIVRRASVPLAREALTAAALVAFAVTVFAVTVFAQPAFAQPAAAEPPAESLRILPESISLTTTQSRQRLVAQRVADGQFQTQAVEGLTWTSSNEAVLRVEDGVAIPVADGTATITASLGELSASAEAVVSGQTRPFQWSFRNHVESVLSKSGCNGGACHGARAGQNGFRLTLFGFDLDADYNYLTRQARGRRINLADPGRSLILTKPTGLIPHKGGLRLEPGTRSYRVLAEWIAAGAPGPAASDAVIRRLEVLPEYSMQSPGATQQFLVLAHFSDGSVEDVTEWAKYTSVDMSVASIDDVGKLNITGSGEGAIKVWYLNINALAFFSVPYPNDPPEEAFAAAPRRNFIDEHVLAKLRTLRLPPSPPADDSAFLRRAYLDTIGVLPTVEETQAFLADASPDKRDRLIDALLTRPEFVDYWAYKWSDLLLASGEKLRPQALAAYSKWIREQVAANTPWDEFARRIVTARGVTFENGAANFYSLHQDPADMAETVAQAFLGLSINCAKCHNHPLEKWTNDQYYGMANMFARVRAKGWGGDFSGGDGNRVVFSDTQGELLQPSTGKPQAPRPLDAEAVPFDDPADRRDEMADWLTSPENPYFTRAITNRVWANFFGVGLVEKVDDMRVTNPPSNELLLDAAADYLAEKKYDLKELMRAILRSATYQRSSEPLPGNQADSRFYSRCYPKRLKAEVLLDALSKVTGSATQFKDQKAGARALELADSAIPSYFLSTFGRPLRIITCECERSDEPSMTQVLHLYNGDTLNAKLQAADNRLSSQLAAGLAPEQIIAELYLSALCRPPRESEQAKLLAVLAEAPPEEKRQALEDLYWSVLTSREFLFNH